MRVALLAVFTLLFASEAKAQVLNPVKWAYAAKRISATEAVVMLKATIDKGWHIYSQNSSGALKTGFVFNSSKEYTLTGKTIEPKPIVKYEPAIKTSVSYFENEVVFQQRVKLRSNAKTVTGKLEYMACKTQCLPPQQVEFTIPIGK